MAQLKDSLITGDLRVTGTIYGNATSATALKDRTNNTLTYSNYGAAGLAGSSISWMTCWNGYELRAISKAETFNLVRDNGGNSTWVNVSGDTMTGALNFANNTYNKMGDDAQIGDANQAGRIAIKGINGATGIYFAPYSGSTAQSFTIDGAGTATLTGSLSTTNLTLTNTTDATSSTAAGMKTAGGLAVAKKIWLGSGLGASSNNNNSSHLIISSSDTGAGGNVALELWRGTNASWQISNESGNLHFRTNYTTAKQATYSVDAINIAYNTGNTIIKGTVTAPTFIGALDGNAATATKLGTSTIGSSERGIYLNAGTPTALTWYPHGVNVGSGNKNNYPWHRVATTNMGTSSWVDKDAILIIRQRFNGGKYGVIKISARANNATTSPKESVDISAVWMIRYGFAENDIRICKKGLSGESNQIDVYVKCTTYMRAIAYFMEGSNAGWTLIASNEVNDTTTTNKLTSTEVWADITTTSGATTYDTITNATDNASSYVKKVGDTMTGTLQIVNDTQNDSTTDALLYVRHRAGNDWNIKVDSTGYDYGINVVTADNAAHAITTNGYITGAKVYGAVWNDYAEFRKVDNINPGYCVIEKGDDTLTLSTARLQPGAEIVSDTFGFAIGETDECKTPIAVSGRVLAYPYEDREDFKKNIGCPVCSGPNGTVSIMSDEEYKEKGYLAIGTISAVPDYEEWGTGKVKVNGRVWIRIK